MNHSWSIAKIDNWTLAEGLSESKLSLTALLTAARKKMPHGAWGPYLRDEIGIPPKTANNYMRLFREWDNSQPANRPRMAETSVTALLSAMAKPRQASPRIGSASRTQPRTATTDRSGVRPEISAVWGDVVQDLDLLCEPSNRIHDITARLVTRIDALRPVLTASPDVPKSHRESIERNVASIDATLEDLTALKTRLTSTLFDPHQE